MSKRRFAGAAAAAAAIVLGVAAWGGDIPLPNSHPSPEPRVEEPVDVPAAVRTLEKLTVAPAGSMTGYDRDRFEHWSSRPAAGTGCNTREAVLHRDGRGVQVDTDCTPTAGTWISPYTGASIGDYSDLEIDHVVPLANAWRSGAADWTAERRERFANDLEAPQLLAVEGSVNQSKSDSGPEEWLPDTNRCQYASDWIEIKTEYALTVTAAERAALGRVLDECR